MGLDRLESDAVLNLRERCLAGTQEDRDIVEAVFVDQAGDAKAEARTRPPTPMDRAAGLRFESCDFGDRIPSYESASSS